MHVARLALAGAVATAALALTGCGQESVANDNRNSQRTDRTQVEPTIIRTPVRVSDAPSSVPLPGPTGGAQDESSTGQNEGEPAETSERGPDGT